MPIKWNWKCQSRSHVRLSVTSWTITCQPLAWEFSRQEYWGGQPFPSPGDLTNLGIEPVSLASPAMQADSLPSEPLGKPKELANRSRTVVGFGSLFATFYEILQERWAERRFWFPSRQERVKVVQQLGAGWTHMTRKGSLPSLTFHVVPTEAPFMWKRHSRARKQRQKKSREWVCVPSGAREVAGLEQMRRLLWFQGNDVPREATSVACKVRLWWFKP